MSIGNDIVDILAPEARDKHLDQRFVGRAFTPREQDTIHSSRKPGPMLWALWACKEAAYKAVSRNNPGVSSWPKKYEVELDKQGNKGAGWVTTPAGVVYVRVIFQEKFVHAIGAMDPEDLDRVRFGIVMVPGCDDGVVNEDAGLESEIPKDAEYGHFPLFPSSARAGIGACKSAWISITRRGAACCALCRGRVPLPIGQGKPCPYKYMPQGLPPSVGWVEPREIQQTPAHVPAYRRGVIPSSRRTPHVSFPCSAWECIRALDVGSEVQNRCCWASDPRASFVTEPTACPYISWPGEGIPMAWNAAPLPPFPLTGEGRGGGDDGINPWRSQRPHMPSSPGTRGPSVLPGYHPEHGNKKTLTPHPVLPPQGGKGRRLQAAGLRTFPCQHVARLTALPPIAEDLSEDAATEIIFQGMHSHAEHGNEIKTETRAGVPAPTVETRENFALDYRKPGIHPSDSSAMVRRLALKDISQFSKLDYSTMEIRRKNGPHGLGPPVVHCKDKPLPVTLSLSHDGPYLAWAFDGPL
ncbi:MAG: 4'-phosphopantetheinyl transferase superfamily protein [Desulfatibacillum sp.]|nr:4'-phosphopantetheinyl transferase superfamily protein [Desulfatibacillum sp.]